MPLQHDLLVNYYSEKNSEEGDDQRKLDNDPRCNMRQTNARISFVKQQRYPPQAFVNRYEQN